MASLAKILYIKARFEQQYWCSPASMPEYEQLRGKKKCLVFLAADYGNLGDVAITHAQEQFLKQRFPEHEVVDVPISKTLSHLKTIKSICSPKDIVTIVGGGNMSDLYFDIELLRQMVVMAFPNSRIISFPQTMFFSDTVAGRYLKKQARKTYSNHSQLTIAAREKWSYKTMKEMMPHSLLLPDIVMTLDEREPQVVRKGITLCLRNDAESTLSNDFKTELRTRLSENYAVVDYDTHINRGGLSLKERENELHKIWSQFRRSEWVITDRLHGMIFAFITGTPCIVLPNNNFKIEGCYNWIKDCNFVLFLENASVSSIDQLLKLKIDDFNFEGVSMNIRKKINLLLDGYQQ